WEASDFCSLYIRFTEAVDGVKAHIVALHGIQSHSGWYTWSSRKLAEAGFAVHFMDCRGSGLNWQARGDTPRSRRLGEDVTEYVRELAARSAEPIFLMAGSWGAKVGVEAALWLQDLEARLRGLVFWCPGLFP